MIGALEEGAEQRLRWDKLSLEKRILDLAEFSESGSYLGLCITQSVLVLWKYRSVFNSKRVIKWLLKFRCLVGKENFIV